MIQRINKNGMYVDYDLVIEGELKGQNGVGLVKESYSSGDLIHLEFFKGDAICLYKDDIKKLVEYLKKF